MAYTSLLFGFTSNTGQCLPTIKATNTETAILSRRAGWSNGAAAQTRRQRRCTQAAAEDLGWCWLVGAQTHQQIVIICLDLLQILISICQIQPK